MRLTRQQRQFLIIGAILVVATLGGAVGSSIGIFDNTLQASAYDTMILAAGDAPRNQVTIVAIDDATISRYGRWPLPRSAYVDAIRSLKAFGPRVIGFDVGFYDPSDRPDEDAAFAAAIKDAGNVVLAMQGVGQGASGGGMLRYQSVQLPIPVLRDAAAGVAAVNIIPELDGRVRRANLIVSDGTRRYYSLPFLAAAMQLRSDLSTLRIEGDRLVMQTPFKDGNNPLGERTIPVDEGGDMRVYYIAPPATSLVVQKAPAGGPPTYPCRNAREMCVLSLADVVDGRIAADTLRPLLQNRIVLVGAHSASGLPDDYPVPNSQEAKMFGVEIWANVAQTILTGRFPILRDDTPLTVLWLALVTLAGIALVARFRLLGFLLALGVLAGYALVAVVLFAVAVQTPGIVRAPSLAYVAAGAPFWWIVLIGYLQLEEQASVRNTQRAFGLAVTPEVAKHILDMQDHGQLTLGGQMREATVLFGDIRGFTTMSEGMGPSELMGTLNRYFDGMVQIVQKWAGTVNKYNGDNIMVIWGAPIPAADHAKRAVQCALELQQFVVSERRKGGPDVAFGFGINSGELVAGFLGAQGRFEYTVIGDTVNVASRLTSGDIARRDNVAVSDRTLQALLPDVEYVDLGEVQVKGRAEPVHCYQINRVGEHRTPNPAPPPKRSVRRAAVAGFH